MEELKDGFYIRLSIDGVGGSASTTWISREDLAAMSVHDFMQIAAKVGENAFKWLTLNRKCKACGHPLP
jgi:hypothetical protein